VPKTVAVSELKTHCLRLVDEVARERRELIVTKRGKPIARLSPIDRVLDERALRGLHGTLLGGDSVADFDTGAIWNATTRR
jgi:prevent-host-death family protein